jgi:tyrosine-specific transport protein
MAPTWFTKQTSAIFLVSGTCIGAATLALPLVLFSQGLLWTFGLFLLVWSAMYCSGIMLAEVSYTYPAGTHLITMVKQQGGRGAQVVVWCVYLLLLYSLLALYLSGVSDLVQGWLFHGQDSQTYFVWELLLVALMGGLLFFGLDYLARVNRFLMSLLMIVFIALTLLLMPYGHWVGLFAWQVPHNIGPLLPVVVTAFGYQVVVPSLRRYLGGQSEVLKRTVFWGSLWPLVIYLIWILVIFALLNAYGPHIAMRDFITSPASFLPHLIERTVDSVWSVFLINGFMLIAILTSFIGISISLCDFVRDGLHHVLAPRYSKSVSIFLALIPPLVFVLIEPHGFMLALHFAGLLVALLNVLLPALLWWFRGKGASLTLTGWFSLGWVVLFGLTVIVVDLWT